MKKISKAFSNAGLVLSLLSLIIIWSCSDDDYLISTGIHEAQFEGTIFDYLNSKPIHFDSVTKIIELAGMEEVFNEDTITFFAPSNPSIIQSVRALNANLYSRGQDTVSDLNQVSPEVWRELLSLYIVEGEYLLKDIPQLDTINLDAFSGQGFISYGGRPMNVGVVYFDAGEVQYAGYRQLYYSYMSNLANQEESMINVAVASSDIQPNNGVVHVLRYVNHPFGFRENIFVTRALAEGINDNQNNSDL